MAKMFYQYVSINRNSKTLKKSIMDYLKKEWNWNDDDFQDGMKETRYSLSFELINDNKDELLTDSRDLSEYIEKVKQNGKVSISSVTKR